MAVTLADGNDCCTVRDHVHLLASRPLVAPSPLRTWRMWACKRPRLTFVDIPQGEVTVLVFFTAPSDDGELVLAVKHLPQEHIVSLAGRMRDRCGT